MDHRNPINYTKQCKVCKATLPADKFKPDKRSTDNLASTCIPCLDDWEYHVEVREIYEQMYIRQKFRCAICNRKVSINKILVDFDRTDIHEEVRGLVCKRCNKLLRLADRDPRVLRAYIEYLTPTEVSSSPPPSLVRSHT